MSFGIGRERKKEEEGKKGKRGKKKLRQENEKYCRQLESFSANTN